MGGAQSVVMGWEWRVWRRRGALKGARSSWMKRVAPQLRVARKDQAALAQPVYFQASISVLFYSSF